MSNMLLEAKEIHTYYGASHILHGLDFHIREGEGIALMGRNGMGKSTLIKSMLGLVRPRHGRVLVRGDEAVLTAKQRQFLYLPFMHGEDKASQARSVALFEALGEADALLFAQAHRDVIARFKRFPSRNEALGRTTTPAEAAWLASPEARF